jgi:sulfatase modifying factor 1
MMTSNCFSRSGIDEFGQWAEFDVKRSALNHTVTQRMRYVAPQKFWMGSPENESGRFDNEYFHEVELTKGFWIADTTCTRMLWTAVMGKDPGCFKRDMQHPIETVSWDDCKEFTWKLNNLVPYLDARLPTEVEWECACRAGVTSMFSLKGNITSDEVNFDGRYNYVGTSRGTYRGHTVPVKSLPPNPWGLYEVHGNVWEWCEDLYNDYDLRTCVVDSIGLPVESCRVVRGGSWYGRAMHARSSCRDCYLPNHSSSVIGFRIARDQCVRETK